MILFIFKRFLRRGGYSNQLMHIFHIHLLYSNTYMYFSISPYSIGRGAGVGRALRLMVEQFLPFPTIVVSWFLFTRPKSAGKKVPQQSSPLLPKGLPHASPKFPQIYTWCASFSLPGTMAASLIRIRKRSCF